MNCGFLEFFFGVDSFIKVFGEVLLHLKHILKAL